VPVSAASGAVAGKVAFAVTAESFGILAENVEVQDLFSRISSSPLVVTGVSVTLHVMVCFPEPVSTTWIVSNVIGASSAPPSFEFCLA